MSFDIPIRRDGVKFLIDFPKWADERTTTSVYYDDTLREIVIMIVHPEYPPHRFNHKTTEWEVVKT